MWTDIFSRACTHAFGVPTEKMKIIPNWFLNKNFKMSLREPKARGNLIRLLRAFHSLAMTTKTVLFLILTFNFLLLTSPKAFADIKWGNQADSTDPNIDKSYGYEVAGSAEGIYTTNDGFSLRFTCQVSTFVTNIYVPFSCKGGRAITINLAPDNAGKPDFSKIYSTNTWTVPDDGYLRWETWAVNPSSPFVSGQVYHIVFRKITGAPNNDYADKPVLLHKLSQYRSNGTYDDKLNTLFSDAGAAYTEINKTPAFIIKYSNGSYESNVYVRGKNSPEFLSESPIGLLEAHTYIARADIDNMPGQVVKVTDGDKGVVKLEVGGQTTTTGSFDVYCRIVEVDSNNNFIAVVKDTYTFCTKR